MLRVIILLVFHGLSGTGLCQSFDQTLLLRHPYVTSFTGQSYAIPMGQIMNHIEKRLDCEIQSARFDDSTKYTMIYSDQFQEYSISLNFHVSDSLIDSCVFEGSQPLVFDFFVGYWPGVGDAGTIQKDGIAKTYFRSDMIMYREMDSLSAQIVITPISL